MKIRLCILMFITLGMTAFGQEIKVEARLDTTQALIGDQVNLWFLLEHPEGLKIDFPVLVDSIAGKIEILSRSGPDTVSKANRIWKLRQRLVVTSFDTGLFVIPPLPFVLTERHDTIKTHALPFQVFAMPVDTTKGITDIKPPYDMKVTFSEILPYLVALLVLAVIILVYFRFFHKKKPVVTDIGKPAPPLLPAHIIALEQLDELVREKLWQQGKIKLYYSRLTDIIRQYIELRFNVPAMEQTTEDINRDFLHNKLIKEEIRIELKALLELADLVKFAKWNPVTEEHESSQQAAYDFILRTKPVINLRKPVEEKESSNSPEVTP